MNITILFISNEIVSALGWTLVNIIWQGSIIALLLGLLLAFFRRTKSQTRYLMSILSLLLIVGLSVYNFSSSYKNAKETSNSEYTTVSVGNNSLHLSEIVDGIFDSKSYSQDNILDTLKKIDVYFPILVNFWLGGVLLFMLKFSFGLLYFKRIKHRNTNPINHIWVNRFSEIEQKLAIRKRIRYIESAIVKVPLVLGYLKPVVIIPAGLLSGVPENQIEAIVAHELAHIRRNDFLVNILQSIIEMIFFFHPAVWYISSQIRTERENCCDDIAITLCDESLTYVKALVSVQELKPGKVYSAVAFSGQKKQLLNRIKRVIMNPTMRSNLNDRIVATAIVVIGIAIVTLSFSFNTKTSNAATLDSNEALISEMINPVVEKPNIAKIVSVNKIIVKDTLKKTQKRNEINIYNNTVIKTFRDKDDQKMKEMKFTLKGGNVSELYVDGKKIPESEYQKYQPEIDKTLDELKDAKEDIKRAMIEIENIDIEKIKAEVEESMKDVKIDMIKIQEEIARSMEEIEEIDIEKIMKEVQYNLQNIQKIDFEKQMADIQKSIADIQCIDMEEIQRQMEEARRQIEEVDFEKIRAQMEFNVQHIHENIDHESIKKEMERVQEELSKLDFARINLELDETFDSIDKEKMMNEMQKELQKLEGLELEKK